MKGSRGTLLGLVSTRGYLAPSTRKTKRHQKNEPLCQERLTLPMVERTPGRAPAGEVFALYTVGARSSKRSLIVGASRVLGTRLARSSPPQTMERNSRASRLSVHPRLGPRDSVFAGSAEHYRGDNNTVCSPFLRECVMAMEDCYEEVRATRSVQH